MPTYDYACISCGDFDAIRPMAERSDPCPCPACGKAALRVLVAMSSLACTTDDQRRAYETNERAQHMPRSSRDMEGKYSRLRHPSGCGCCNSSSKRSSTVTAPNGAKTFPSKRPWMISH